MNKQKLYEYMLKIVQYYDLGNSNNIKLINSGFNRIAFDIDDKYILKIWVNHDKEKGIENEIKFHNNNKNNQQFYPKAIIMDGSKKLIPYVFIVEEKICGKNLFKVWEQLKLEEKKLIIAKLTDILKQIHSNVVDEDYNTFELIDKYKLYFEKCKKAKIFSEEEIKYLNLLENIMPFYLVDAECGYIHGDIHFDNIILTKNEEIKIIDFECYGIAPIDKEFDSINRMVRNPNSFLSRQENSIKYDEKEYLMIMNYFKSFYPSICNNENFKDRLIIYDCLNSMKWISIFPNHQLYHDVLFNDSKELIKKIK